MTEILEKIQRLLIRIAHLFGRRFGAFVAHKFEWTAFITDEFAHAHANSCPSPDVETLLRIGGLVKRCRACRTLVGIKFSCWETEDGFMPAEVMKWFKEELARGK